VAPRIARVRTRPDGDDPTVLSSAGDDNRPSERHSERWGGLAKDVGRDVVHISNENQANR
jgi:hypothetical protein